MREMRWARSLRTHLKWAVIGVVFWVVLALYILILGIWTVTLWLTSWGRAIRGSMRTLGREPRRSEASQARTYTPLIMSPSGSEAKRYMEALSPPDLMAVGEEPLPEPDGDVAILPEYSPSMHSLSVFDPDADPVQVVTRAEAEEAGFTPCVRCWTDVDPGTPKTVDELDLDEEDLDP